MWMYPGGGIRFPRRHSLYDVTHLCVLSPPDSEVVAETADGGEESDHDDQDGDAGGDGWVRDPLIRRVGRRAVVRPLSL